MPPTSKKKKTQWERGPSAPPSSTTMFGTDRAKHEDVTKTLGSFPRSVGAAADARELEYVSSLHQNAEKFLRSDGTICSKDIPPYLSSRYGMEITHEQAVDIALNLCGAKPRSELDAELDILALNKGQREIVVEEAQEESDGEEEEEEEEVYYFDLVQLMSLLIIPELLQLGELKPQGKQQFQSYSKSTNGEASELNDTSKPILAKDGDLLGMVLMSITDVLGEPLQQELLRDGKPLDVPTLSLLLEAFGDVDSASDKELLAQMLQALGDEDDPDKHRLDHSAFLRALTGDVGSYNNSKDQTKSAQNKTVADATVNTDTIQDPRPPAAAPAARVEQTSTFYDVFGRNWGDFSSTTDMQNAPEPKDTANYIDYAADSYGSTIFNTSVWVLFILTTLVYVQFFLLLIEREGDGKGGLICFEENEDGTVYACQIANKVLGWIIRAFFCGLYGMFFLIPTSIGNVPGKTRMVYVSLVVTAVYAYAPFIMLILYRQGIPYNAEVINTFEVVCPGYYDNITQLRDAQATLQDSPEGAQGYLTLDSECSFAIDWCSSHIEVQGKYIDRTPWWLTYDEFEHCYNYMEENYPPDSDNNLFGFTGQACDPFSNTTCAGWCALENVGHKDTLFEGYVCCNSGGAANFVSTRYQDANHTQDYDWWGNWVCEHSALNGTECIAGVCEEDTECRDGVCVPNEDAKSLYGAPCDRDHSQCSSGFCWDGVCQEQPRICPDPSLTFLAGFRLDPFCRTKDIWCRNTKLQELKDSLEGALLEMGIELALGENGTLCEDIIEELVTFGVLALINETDADVGHSRTELNYSDLEVTVDDEYTFLVLLSIAVMGFFAIASILKKVVQPKTDARPTEYSTKLAGANKLSNMIENAMMLHPRTNGKGRVMRNFFLRGEETVEVGGLFSTIRKMASGNISSQEGIRYPGRIWVGQVAQIVVFIVLVSAGITFVVLIGQMIDDEREELGRSYSQLDVAQLTNKEWADMTAGDLIVTPDENAILLLLPLRWQFDAAAYSGILAGILVATFSILLYIPSTTNTIMKLRNGQMPSLHDPYFDMYRKQGDNVVQNIGNMVFSLLGSCVLMVVIVFALVFVFMYEWTRSTALGYVFAFMGIGVTIVIKMIGTKLLRAKNFSTFYRKNPKGANFANLFFECWYIGTGSALVIVSRLVMFLICGALWLGRIDVEFLHPDVKVLGKGLDKVPVGFKRDILVHEAHNHPYIERLGGMYLRKLRDGDTFGTKAGTAWRTLFVAALMPWLVKHKVNYKEEASLEDITTTNGPIRRRQSMSKSLTESNC